MVWIGVIYDRVVLGNNPLVPLFCDGEIVIPNIICCYEDYLEVFIIIRLPSTHVMLSKPRGKGSM